jgi:hypothetical protein
LLDVLPTAAVAQEYVDSVDNVDNLGAQYNYRDWIELGCQNTVLGLDNEVIYVTQRARRFDAIRLAVRDADLELRDLDVIYGDGPAEDIALSTVLRGGDRTIPLLLRGRDHFIDHVELLYQMVSSFPGRLATICVEGRDAQASAGQALLAGGGYQPCTWGSCEPIAASDLEPLAANDLEPLAAGNWTARAGDGFAPLASDAWAPCGCSDIAPATASMESLFTGQSDGIGRAVRLKLLGVPQLDLVSLGVRYADGRVAEIPLGTTLRNGEYTPALNLAGWGGAISRIDLLHRVAQNAPSRATVCLEGMR